MWLSLIIACQDDNSPTDETGTTDDGVVTCADVDRTNCVEIAAGDSATLQDTVNTLSSDTAIVLAAGTYVLDNAVTIRDVTGITLIGQGKDNTILDFTDVAAQVNGVDVVVDDFHIEGLNIINAKKDGLRIEDSDGIVIRAVKVEWTNGPDPSNGAYGIYPVRVQHVLMEDSESHAASDAGIYVGQCQHAIIRNNLATQNVAGMEIENTQFADVYGNHAEDNTAGIVAFDLPGNPIVGRDIQIHDNVIINNNHENFAPGGTVAVIPAGTGTFVMASRRVEVFDNTYKNNNTVDIAILSGFVVESDPAQWAIPLTDLEGDVTGLDLDGDGSTFVANFRSRDVYVHDNTHEGSGDRPDAASFDRELGILLAAVYGDTPVDTVLYDSIIETSFDPVDPAGNSNDNGTCVAATAGVTFGSLNLDDLANAPVLANVYRPAAPFAPFDCVGPAITAPSGVAGQ